MLTAAHRQYKIEQRDNILLVDAQGPFCEVTARQYHRDIMLLTDSMTNEAWGSLITFRGNSIFTPDAQQQLIDTTRYRQKKGMVAIAVVILNSVNADMQQMQLQQIYYYCQIDFHVFSDINNAKNWLLNYIKKGQ